MPMASMKRQPKLEVMGMEKPDMSDEYGWGLCIDIADDQMAALGMTQPMPVGSVVTIVARAVITRTCMKGSPEDMDSQMTAQITDMEIKPDEPQHDQGGHGGPEGGPRPDMAQTIYGGH